MTDNPGGAIKTMRARLGDELATDVDESVKDAIDRVEDELGDDAALRLEIVDERS